MNKTPEIHPSFALEKPASPEERECTTLGNNVAQAIEVLTVYISRTEAELEVLADDISNAFHDTSMSESDLLDLKNLEATLRQKHATLLDEQARLNARLTEIEARFLEATEEFN